MDQTSQSNWKKEIFIYALLIFVGALLWSLVPSCEHPKESIPQIDSTVILKAQIRQHLNEKDSLRKLAQRKDSVRLVPIIKWYKDKEHIKPNQPCDTIKKYIPQAIADCDSIINKGNDYIHTLKDEQAKSDTIISEQARVIALDSLNLVSKDKEIKSLKKTVKHKNGWNKFWKGTTIAAVLVAIFK